ncbi:GDNF family receptor alpha-like [Colossoma macropomum]|uniref:GDNF family receptor alpha-like n=1 Tax=Colossoma macropomum TaxID=42526 RepID=UPI00186443FB|nr:GDNF family receptor alpha-like [Colossoma macropomum]
MTRRGGVGRSGYAELSTLTGADCASAGDWARAMRAMKAAAVIVICLAWRSVCSRISSGCLSVMRPCISPDLCASEQNLLRKICDSEDGRCELQGSERCNVTILTILGHSPSWRECVCADEDSCSALQLLASHCLSHLVPGPNSSCLQEMTLCVQDKICNRHLVPFVQSCSDPQCEDSRCRLATRRFFSGLPQTVAETLVFCECERDDQDCQDVQNTLYSSSCSGGHTLPWNCLEMLDSCTGDELCSLRMCRTDCRTGNKKAVLPQTFEGFLSNCFGQEGAPLSGYSTRDLIHLIDLDIFLSGDKECRMAFVATMGSILQSPCTCHGLHRDDLYRCNILQQAIQNRSHFSKYLRTVTISPLSRPGWPQQL